MCDKAVDNYVHALQFVPDYYKAQKICNKAVNISRSSIQFVSECYKNLEMCDKSINTWSLYLVLFAIDIRLKKFVTELFPKILLC